MRSCWKLTLPLVMVALATIPATAQTSCTQAARAALLAQFSDSAPNASITPSNVRNGWCSVQFVLDAGATAAVQGGVTTPFVFSAQIAGSLQIDQGKVEVSRDSGVTYYPVSLLGGTVPVLFGDKVRLTWFSTVTPTVVFFPAEGQ